MAVVDVSHLPVVRTDVNREIPATIGLDVFMALAVFVVITIAALAIANSVQAATIDLVVKTKDVAHVVTVLPTYVAGLRARVDGDGVTRGAGTANGVIGATSRHIGKDKGSCGYRA